jgi:hypothetical protein
MEEDPNTGFRKLTFLLQNPPFPPETFCNLLLLYLKHAYYDVAADLLAENAALTYKYLTPELYEFMEAQIMVQTSPEEVRSARGPSRRSCACCLVSERHTPAGCRACLCEVE